MTLENVLTAREKKVLWEVYKKKARRRFKRRLQSRYVRFGDRGQLIEVTLN